MALADFDHQNIWHPYTPLTGAGEPILVRSASGIYLHTSNGRKIVDAISSWWVNLHGHSNPVIAEAINQQARELEHVIFAGFTHEPAIQLSKNLLSILPGNQSKIFFSDDGSTAVEVALKMAFQFWHNQGIQKTKIVAIDGAYHGDTFGAMSVGERGLFTNPFSNFLFDTQFIDFPSGDGIESIAQFQSIAESEKVAAFIYEPIVQGAAGMRMYSPDVLDRLLSVAKTHDVICIADEVMTGFGRTGKLFASDHASNKPDIIALSKGLTGGAMPMGVTSCSQKIVNAFYSDDFTKTFFHGHSYTANPLACAAANASFNLLMKDSCQQRIGEISSAHVDFSKSIRNHPKIHSVRSQGTILAVELITDEKTSYSNNERKKIYEFFLNRNILLRPLGNVIYIIPPYIITDEELKTIYEAIKGYLDLRK